MKYAYFRLLPVASIDRVDKTVMITNQRRNVLLSKRSGGIPAVVSEIVDDQIKFVGQERPERVVEIDGQPVAVAQNESRSRRISVASQGDDGGIIDADVVG